MSNVDRDNLRALGLLASAAAQRQPWAGEVLELTKVLPAADMKNHSAEKWLKKVDVLIERFQGISDPDEGDTLQKLIVALLMYRTALWNEPTDYIPVYSAEGLPA